MIRVLVVDDSALVRKVLTAELNRFSDIVVVGTATDPYVARERIVELSPDVITLDVEMPRMDGLSFLARLMKHYPLPVVVVSSLTPERSDAALRALELGAVDVVPKPGSTFSIPDVSRHLVHAVRAAARAQVGRLSSAGTGPISKFTTLDATHKIVAIGASTGGTKALEMVLRGFPGNGPGTALVQHMPAGFTGPFAERLDGLCAMEVRQAADGDALVPGVVLLAPGNKHMVVERSGASYQVRVRNGPLVHHQRPSVDVLFHSVARAAGRNTVGAILTGMGSDGARGLLAMKQAGGWTIAQDEASCVVFGMPKEAIRLDAADAVVPLNRVASAIMEAAARGQAAPVS